MRLKIDNGEQNVLLPLSAIRPATIHEKKHVQIKKVSGWRGEES